MAGQAPGINGFQYRDAGFGGSVIQAAGGAPVGGMATHLAHHDVGDLGPGRLHVVEVDAVVPDHGRRHDDDLTEVARIGERFLVAGQVGREDHLTEGWIQGPRGRAGEPRAVFQQNESGAIRHPVTPRSFVVTFSAEWERRWLPSMAWWPTPWPVGGAVPWREREQFRRWRRLEPPRPGPGRPVGRRQSEAARPGRATPAWPREAAPGARSGSRRAAPGTARERGPERFPRTTM